MSFWTDHNTAQLRDLIEVQKSSASQAAAALGCSRNAVIGRAKRCGIAFPRRPTQSGGIARPSRRGKTGAYGGIVQRVRARRSPVVFGNLALTAEPFVAEEIELSTEHHCSLLDLKAESCRYAVTDDGPHVFCGIPEANVSEGRPYCTGHARIVYAPRRAA